MADLVPRFTLPPFPAFQLAVSSTYIATLDIRFHLLLGHIADIGGFIACSHLLGAVMPAV